jgi:hypothetical protein
MYDVYLNEKRDRLLVVAKGRPIPSLQTQGGGELLLLATRSSWPIEGPARYKTMTLATDQFN